MQDFETFLKILQNGKTWLDAMLEMTVEDNGATDLKKGAVESLRRKEFENTAKIYLKDVPEISELIKPGRNDTKLKMKTKLSDIVLLGQDIIGDTKLNFDESIYKFKHQMREIINETKLLRDEIKLLKLKEVIKKPSKSVGNKRSHCSNINGEVTQKQKHKESELVNDHDRVKHAKDKQQIVECGRSENTNKYVNNSSLQMLGKHDHFEKVTNRNEDLILKNDQDFVKDSSDVWQEIEPINDSVQKREVNRPLSISDEFISVNSDMAKQMYCGRSIGIVNNNASKELQENSLNNLLIQSQMNLPNSKNTIRLQPDKEHLVIRELFEVLTKKKFPCIEEEEEIFSTNLHESKSTLESAQVVGETTEENEENSFDKASIVTVVSQTNYTNVQEDNEKRNNVFGELADNLRGYYGLSNNKLETSTDLHHETLSTSFDLSSVQDSDCKARTLTVQQITDMLFSLSSVLNEIPEELKYSKIEDLNPPQSMKSAISLLAHISKSVDIVELSESYFDETLDHGAALECKLGHFSLLGRHEYNILRSTAFKSAV